MFVNYFPSMMTCALVSALFVSSTWAADSRNISLPSALETAQADFVYELQVLRQEVQMLRGMLEEQAHELTKLRKKRLEDYVDLDKRIQSLTGMGVPTSDISAEDVVATTDDISEALYNEAIDLLLNQQDYAGAQQKLEQYASQYHKGKYIPNIYYWQGQIQFVDGRLEQALSIFDKLVTQFPEHDKAPDARLKMAKIYFEQGRKKVARVILDSLSAGSGETAQLAQTFIAEHF